MKNVCSFAALTVISSEVSPCSVPDLIGGQAGQAHHQLGQGGQGAGGWRERRRHLSGLSSYNVPACVQSHPLLLQLGAGRLRAVKHLARGTRDMPHLHINSGMVSLD